jgi:hypothetical protein
MGISPAWEKIRANRAYWEAKVRLSHTGVPILKGRPVLGGHDRDRRWLGILAIFPAKKFFLNIWLAKKFSNGLQFFSIRPIESYV